MLEHVGLGMDAIPRHPELLGEEQLQQTVMTKHLQRHTPTLVGQPHAVIGLCSTIPTSVSLRTIPDTDPGVTPSRAARSFVETAAPPRVSSAYTAFA